MVDRAYHEIALIPGDLNGITVTDAAVQLARASAHLLTKPANYTSYPYNADYFNRKGLKELGEEELGNLRRHDAIFEGAIGDPTKIKPGTLEIGILLKIRQAFDQYVNLRPIVLPEGVPSVIVGKDHRHVNFDICRENSEGLYVGKGRVMNPGTEDEVGIQEMHCSYRGVKRLVEYAIQRAILKGAEKGRKPRLHIVFKNNVLTFAAVPWNRVYQEVKASRPDIDVKYMHTDNFSMQMVVGPEQFDAVATENMFGDKDTDLGAVLAGGIGLAISGNIDPLNRSPSMFEPSHGTAPDKWYETRDGEYVPGTFKPELVQLIRPEAAFLSWAMMLDHLGEKKAAEAIKQATLTNLRNPAYSLMRLDELVADACAFVGRQR